MKRASGLMFDVLVDPHMHTWLVMQQQLGLANNTLSAYARALVEYFTFCQDHNVNLVTATKEHIAQYVHLLATRPVRVRTQTHRLGLSNATIHQRLVAVRLYYDYLQEKGLRDTNPLPRGRYTSGTGYGGYRRGLLPHFHKLPWIPTDEQWNIILQAALAEPIRNRFMLALAYDAGLRREELCSLRTTDIDPTSRLVTLRAETTKTRRARVVPYSETTGILYAAYLGERRLLSRERGLLFLSASRRNRAAPITIWTWSKVVQRIAARAGVDMFTTHTLRHLCLTDLARAGWELHEIATFAGHRSLETTMGYVHLSGRDLATKVANGMTSIHAWRVTTMQRLMP